jgi:hypothetical protein
MPNPEWQKSGRKRVLLKRNNERCESVEYASKKERDRRWEVIQDLQELLL